MAAFSLADNVGDLMLLVVSSKTAMRQAWTQIDIRQIPLHSRGAAGRLLFGDFARLEVGEKFFEVLDAK